MQKILKHYFVYLSADAPINGDLEPELYPCDTEEEVKKKVAGAGGNIDDYFGHWIVFEDGSISQNELSMDEILDLSESLWNESNNNFKVFLLSEQSTVLPALLIENPELVQMIKDGASQTTCLDYINDNF